MKLALITITLLLALGINAHAGKEDYFKKIDTNSNQVLDKTEFAGQMKKYLIKQAITDKSIQKKKLIMALSAEIATVMVS